MGDAIDEWMVMTSACARLDTKICWARCWNVPSYVAFGDGLVGRLSIRYVWVGSTVDGDTIDGNTGFKHMLRSNLRAGKQESALRLFACW
jgi:hypothetical protein